AAVRRALAPRAAVHRDGRALPDPRARAPALRQHDERNRGRRAAPEPRAALRPGNHAGLRPPDRRHPGLHLRRAGDGLHRVGHPRARRAGRLTRTPIGGMMTELTGLEWIGIVSIVMAAVAVGVGSIAPALAEGRAIAQGLASIA